MTKNENDFYAEALTKSRAEISELRRDRRLLTEMVTELRTERTNLKVKILTLENDFRELIDRMLK